MSNQRHLYCVSGDAGSISFPVKVIGASRTAGPSELSWTLSSASRRVGSPPEQQQEGEVEGEGDGGHPVHHNGEGRGIT